jgi:hypothetical protein
MGAKKVSASRSVEELQGPHASCDRHDGIRSSRSMHVRDMLYGVSRTGE